MPLLQILFTSVAEDHEPGDHITEIVADSTRCNAPMGVSSVLLMVGGRYLQCIEGPSDAVYAAMTRILSDRRHHSVTIIGSQHALSLSFTAIGMRLLVGTEAQRVQAEKLLRRVALDNSRELADELLALLQQIDRSACDAAVAESLAPAH
jgi:hypothetical protein